MLKIEQFRKKYCKIVEMVKKAMGLTSILLAGGQNKRMNGLPKWELRIGKEIMIDRSIRRLKTVSKQIIIVSGGTYQFSFLEKEEEFIKLVYDQTPFLGPLNGIRTGLTHSTDLYHFVVAADMPFFSVDLALWMYQLATTNQMDIVIPKWKDKLQPLHAIYSKSLIDAMSKDIEEGKNSLVKWILDQKRLLIVEELDVQEFNQSGKIFFNMNDPEQYMEALSWMIEEEKE